jgi:hypothetical protein
MRARLTKIRSSLTKNQKDEKLRKIDIKENKQADLIVRLIILILILFVVIMDLIYGFPSKFARYYQAD